jgi:hypothetical protein
MLLDPEFTEEAMSYRLIITSTIAACGCVLLPALAWAADAATAECLTASENAYKSAQEHKFLEQRAQLLNCAAEQCPADVRTDCVQRMDDVNRAIPSIVFEVKDSAGNDLSDVKVTMDGTPVAERLDGTAITLDPGKHRFTFEIAGHAPIEKEYVILVSQKERRESITVDSAPAKAETVPLATTFEPQPTILERRSGLGKQQITALIAGGVGVVGVGVGSVFGLISKSKHDDAAQRCNSSICRDQQGIDFKTSAIHAGNVSTVAFIVGAAGLAGGAALWLTAPQDREKSAAAIGLVPGGMLLKGTW